MKSDLDALMEERGLDALLVTGKGDHNPAMVYFTGGGHLTHADLIKLRSADPVLFCTPMERDEAARSGLETHDLGAYRLTELLEQAGGDRVQAAAMRYQRMLADLGLASGRVALYGLAEAGMSYAVFNAVRQLAPELEFVGELDDATLLLAMMTKDAGEIERIRAMGKVTTEVVSLVAEYLASHRADGEMLVQADGSPLTVGDVKRRIYLWLAEREAEAPSGVIFAIGRDAGVPHSSGTDGDPLRMGHTIVFDITPCEAGGGYYFDLTRTWCLGYAPEPVQALYEDVLAVYKEMRAALQAGQHCPEYQQRTCELFQARGHPTVLENPQTTDGYVHSLGHGVGLHVHERPWFGRNASAEDRLLPGTVVTVEPGLYYPERGMGMRLEDTVWVRPDGMIEVLAEYPLDLVLPLRPRKT